ncbi:MAG: alpha/beta fold hydrolase [Deltaproteobacteria bacterium]|nr:alpha/beta fold hydrolase [Deltaproteobacteria bacterium]MBW2420338.1 alpha/beta fold hydrolase [Deltaproteobacteria bacterium]
MSRAFSFASVAALLVFFAASIWLARLDKGGPPHTELMLEGEVPATLYLPGDGEHREAFLDAPPRDERPPAVVMMHGFSGDRLSMSGISRRLAESGYAVLNIDARGHGQNRNPFSSSWAAPDLFYPDLLAAVEFLRAYPFVDGSRIAVMGHSMGAGASLDYASRDSAIGAAVLVSGGWRIQGPHRPPNTLFLYATGDPERIRGRSRQLAAGLAGVNDPEVGRTYGDPTRGDAVRLAEVAGADHQTIVWREAAVRETVAWLDATFGVARSPGPVPDDPRAPLLPLIWAAFLLVMVGLGQVVGRLVPAQPYRPGGGRIAGLAAIAAAFALTMPLLALGTPGFILSMEVGDVFVSHFALAGIVLLVAIRMREPELIDSLFAPRLLPTLIGAAVGTIGVFTLMRVFEPVMHRLTLTPERFLVFVMAALGLLPLALAFNLLLRRGTTAGATLTSLAGRVLVLLVLFAGVQVGILSMVMLFMLPALGFVCLQFEVLAAAIYASSRNLLALSLIDAAWLAMVIAAIMPIRI